MSTAQHTPGPWIANGHVIYGPSHPDSKHGNGRILIASVAVGSGRWNPYLFGGPESFDYDSKLDARLIAAAPELLEALEMVRDADEDAIKDGLPRWCTSAARARIDRAITKAKGGSHE